MQLAAPVWNAVQQEQVPAIALLGGKHRAAAGAPVWCGCLRSPAAFTPARVCGYGRPAPMCLCAATTLQRLLHLHLLHCAQGVGYGLSVAAFFVYQQIKMRQLAGESSAKHGGGGSLSASIAANSSSRMVSSGDLPRYQAVPTAEARAGNIPTTPQTGRD